MGFLEGNILGFPVGIPSRISGSRLPQTSSLSFTRTCIVSHYCRRFDRSKSLSSGEENRRRNAAAVLGNGDDWLK